MKNKIVFIGIFVFLSFSLLSQRFYFAGGYGNSYAKFRYVSEGDIQHLGDIAHGDWAFGGGIQFGKKLRHDISINHNVYASRARGINLTLRVTEPTFELIYNREQLGGVNSVVGLKYVVMKPIVDRLYIGGGVDVNYSYDIRRYLSQNVFDRQLIRFSRFQFAPHDPILDIARKFNVGANVVVEYEWGDLLASRLFYRHSILADFQGGNDILIDDVYYSNFGFAMLIKL